MARILDKERNAQAVIGLVDQLQKAILIYQVCAEGSQTWSGLTLAITDVPTTINPQPDCAVDSMCSHPFPPP